MNMFPVYENKNRVKGYKKLLPGMHQLPVTLTSQTGKASLKCCSVLKLWVVIILTSNTQPTMISDHIKMVAPEAHQIISNTVLL